MCESWGAFHGLEQELTERSLLMVWPAEETIHMQTLQKARLTRVMPFLKKPGEERGVSNKGEGGDGVAFIATIYHHWRSPWRISYKILC